MAKGTAAGALGCGMQTIKYFIFLVNLLFFLVGLALLGVSIWLATEVPKFKEAFEGGGVTFIEAVPAVGIAVGLFIFVASLMGCIGSIKENTCMMKTFITFLTSMMMLEVAIVGLVIAYNVNPELESQLDDYMQIPFSSCTEDPTTVEASCTWLPVIQTELQCCGYNKDENASPSGAKLQCIGELMERTVAMAAANDYCNRAIKDWLREYMGWVAGILGSIFFVEILLLVGSCCLVRGINGENKYA